MCSVPVLMELTSTMGQALFKIQNAIARSVAGSSMGWCRPQRDAGWLEAREVSLQRKTLGQTLVLFKQHVAFADDFATGMREFLNNRNLFAHDFLSLPGFFSRH